MSDPPAESAKAAELRRHFDASFALALTASSPDLEDVLLVRVGGDGYALRLRELAGLVARRPIVPVPSPAPGLLGLAGIRGEIVPVFGLSSLLGYGDDAQTPPWLVLSAAPGSLAFGFSAFEGFVRLPRASLHAAEGVAAARPYLAELVSTDAGPRAVIAVPLLVSTIRNRLGPDRPQTKEQ